MNTTMLPEVGQWYQPVNKGRIFQVVAIDDAERIIEIQKYDGDIDELDFSEWHVTPLHAIDPPEDWSGPMDDAEQDDLDDDGDKSHVRNSTLAPLDSVSPPIDRHDVGLAADMDD